MKLIVAYHHAPTLDSIEVPEGTTKLYLNDLVLPEPYTDNRFAESRALLHLALNPNELLPSSGMLGLMHASYPRKFSLLPPLTQLNVSDFWEIAQYSAYSPVTGPHFLYQAEQAHPGMSYALQAICSRAGIKINDRETIYTNSIITHVSTWKEFLSDWLRMFMIAQEFINPPLYDYSLGKPEVAPAYLLERLTSAWFAQSGLNIKPIVSADGKQYSPMYDFSNERTKQKAK